MTRLSTGDYVAMMVKTVMQKPTTQKEFMDAHNCDKQVPRNVLKILRAHGLIYILRWVTNGTRTMPLWAWQSVPFACSDASKPDNVKSWKVPTLCEVTGKPKGWQSKSAKVEKPDSYCYDDVADIEESSLIVKRKADFHLPVGSPNSVFDLR